MKRSIMGFAFGISYFIPNNETRDTLAPKKCRAFNMAEIRTLTWFRDNVKLSRLQSNVIPKAQNKIFTNSSLNSAL